MSRVFDDLSLTPNEVKILSDWVNDGKDPYDNPWCMMQVNEQPYPFIEAVRILAGLYDKKIKRFIKENLVYLKLTKS